jgi:GNAT superfamily N-acetyltransferase
LEGERRKTSLQIRTLRRDERERLLELLDLWPLPDGWRGCDFFRRYVEDDPTFADENVVVAEEGGALVACVQIFPRPVRMRGRAVPMGGIGSVFTRPEQRRDGVSRRLLGFALERMRERGLLVSLLFAGVPSLYYALGWRAWQAKALLTAREAQSGVRDRDIELRAFDRSRDLAAIREIHARYSGRLDGTVVRDDRLWETTLRVAGNPREEFLVALRDGAVVAYARAVVLSSFLAVSEIGRSADGAEALAALVDRILEPREEDPLATPSRPSAELRRLAALPSAPDAELHVALAARGLAAKPVENPTVMWRCVDGPALARRLDVEMLPGEDGEALLRRVFPPGGFTYWPADRF